MKVSLSLPTLDAHEITELTGPEILRRTLERKVAELERLAGEYEAAADATRDSEVRQRDAAARLRTEAASWAALLDRIPLTTCSLCHDRGGEGCTFACGAAPAS